MATMTKAYIDALEEAVNIKKQEIESIAMRYNEIRKLNLPSMSREKQEALLEEVKGLQKDLKKADSDLAHYKAELAEWYTPKAMYTCM